MEKSRSTTVPSPIFPSSFAIHRQMSTCLSFFPSVNCSRRDASTLTFHVNNRETFRRDCHLAAADGTFLILRFRFRYVPAADESYDDEVVYNFARICNVSQSCLKPTSGASSSSGRWLFTYVTDPGYVVRRDDLPKLTLGMPVCDNATTYVGNCGAS